MWSAPVTLTLPAREPVTIDEAKEFLVIEAEEVLYDQLLARFITAARMQVETMTGTRLVPQTVRVMASGWPDLMSLPIGPVSAVTALEWQDTDGVWQTLDAAIYQLSAAGLTAMIGLKPRQYFPYGLRRVDDAIRVTLEVGYDPVPEPIRTAILIMVADLFAQRESFVVGTVAARVPTSMQVDTLLANYRIWL